MAEQIMSDLYRNTYTEEEISRFVGTWTSYQLRLIQENQQQERTDKTNSGKRELMTNLLIKMRLKNF